jgi:hypothetical protein
MSPFASMKSIYSLFALGLALLVGLGGVAIAGRSPFSSRTEVLPVSVRDNPGSWRPIYGGYTPRPSSSGGSSGGFSGGK